MIAIRPGYTPHDAQVDVQRVANFLDWHAGGGHINDGGKQARLAIRACARLIGANEEQMKALAAMHAAAELEAKRA
jgi:hypothetical protein